MSVIYKIGDNVRINESASGPHQTSTIVLGTVKNVCVHCASGGDIITVVWGNGDITKEIPANLDNLSTLGQPNE